MEMMLLDEAIKHEEEVAKEQDELCKRYDYASRYYRSHNEDIVSDNAKKCLECFKCAKEHKQLAEWLKDYKRLLEQEPCEDCISRQAVDTLVDELARAISDERCFISRGRSTATIMQDMLDLPPVTLQHTDVDIQKMQELEQAEIQKAYELGKEDKIKVLDKIRAEIWDLQYGDEEKSMTDEDRADAYNNAIIQVIEIIDKYNAKSEG